MARDRSFAMGPQGAPQGVPRKPCIFRYLYDFEIISWIFNEILWFWVSKPCFLSFSTQNHAESFRKYLKKSIWEPKGTKLNQNSDFGHGGTSGGNWGNPGGPPVVFVFLKNHYIYIKKNNKKKKNIYIYIYKKKTHTKEQYQNLQTKHKTFR